MKIRKAESYDLQSVDKIYNEILTKCEETGTSIGWVMGIYPTLDTATKAFNNQSLFVMEDESEIVGAGIIDHVQFDSYRQVKWSYDVSDNDVMVFHTLVISPTHSGKGLGTQFVKFYEDYALENGCIHLRMDTNVINKDARRLYKKLDYTEVGTTTCTFNGIEGITLVLLEKKLHR